jgi:probable rRNA maturation factor
MNPSITLTNRHPRLRPAHRPLEMLARRVFAGEHKRGTADVILIGSALLHSLNRRFLQHDRTTDVLSFPFGAAGKPDSSGYWGEVYINLDLVNTDAKNNNTTLKEALAWRMVHGLLHLFGYDHRTKDEIVLLAGRERRYLKAAGFSYSGWESEHSSPRRQVLAQ